MGAQSGLGIKLETEITFTNDNASIASACTSSGKNLH